MMEVCVRGRGVCGGACPVQSMLPSRICLSNDCPPHTHTRPYALYSAAHDHRHVSTLLVCVNYAQRSIRLNHSGLRTLVRDVPAWAGGGGRAWERVQRGRDGEHRVNGVSVRSGCPPGEPKTKGDAARTRDTKPRSRTHHETGSVGGKQTERNSEFSTYPNLGGSNPSLEFDQFFRKKKKKN